MRYSRTVIYKTVLKYICAKIYNNGFYIGSSLFLDIYIICAQYPSLQTSKPFPYFSLSRSSTFSQPLCDCVHPLLLLLYYSLLKYYTPTLCGILHQAQTKIPNCFLHIWPNILVKKYIQYIHYWQIKKHQKVE